MKLILPLLSVCLAATVLQAAPQAAPATLVPDWKRLTLENAKCGIDMPARVNFRKVERIEQPEGRGLFGAEGVVSTEQSKLGMFLVMSGVTTKFSGSEKDLRRFIGFLSGKVDGMMQKMFADAFTLKEKRPVTWKTGTGTDYIYVTNTDKVAVRMRKLILSDRAYFLIGVGAPGDVERFLKSLDPLPVGT
ncbi:MAG: hypothetical protein ACOYM3_07920 [Terrimicrobiaceae bacterium]